MERVSLGMYGTPDTYRYISPTYPLGSQFTRATYYTFQTPPKLWTASGTLIAVHGVDHVNAEVIARVSGLADVIIVSFPRAVLDPTFLDASAAVKVLKEMPPWQLDDPWGFPVMTDGTRIPNPPAVVHHPIIVIKQAQSVALATSPHAWSVATITQTLTLNMYIEAYCGGVGKVWRGKVVAVRVVERDWFQFIIFVHPDYIQDTQSDFVYLWCPSTHAKLNEEADSVFVRIRKRLPKCFGHCSLPLPDVV